MLECLILGDSIAKGISHTRPECVAYVQGGINSSDYNNIYRKNIKPAKNTIISLGSNDYAGLNTEVELVALRSSIREGRVFWIVPAIKPAKQKLVVDVARSYGDVVIHITELSQDKVHPTYRGYRQLGELTK
jgi:hypothetical protein